MTEHGTRDFESMTSCQGITRRATYGLFGDDIRL